MSDRMLDLVEKALASGALDDLTDRARGMLIEMAERADDDGLVTLGGESFRLTIPRAMNRAQRRAMRRAH